MTTRYTFLFHKHFAGESWSRLAIQEEAGRIVAVAKVERAADLQDALLPTFVYQPFESAGRLREWLERGEYEERDYRFTPYVPASYDDDDLDEEDSSIEGFATTPEENFHVGGTEPV